jgi:Domain of unknown function (DUF4180)
MAKYYSVAPDSYFACASEGKKLRSDRDAVDLIGEAQGCPSILIPAERLDEDFFRLRTGVAGAFLQKFVTYGRRVAILGDISRYMEESSAWRDFVVEANRGGHVWFVQTIEDLDRRIAQSRD